MEPALPPPGSGSGSPPELPSLVAPPSSPGFPPPRASSPLISPLGFLPSELLCLSSLPQALPCLPRCPSASPPPLHFLSFAALEVTAVVHLAPSVPPSLVIGGALTSRPLSFDRWAAAVRAALSLIQTQIQILARSRSRSLAALLPLGKLSPCASSRCSSFSSFSPVPPRCYLSYFCRRKLELSARAVVVRFADADRSSYCCSLLLALPLP